ncbi:MAG: hypothetical protein KatS3mg025_0942 [Bacteroidia bacterium]|nr:MAG: hypothetical protein KatS3mg025_0942 [Bacteroidia bacterium]
MQEKDIIEALWEDYQRERRRRLDKKAFGILLRVFPSVMVAQADGFTDTSEMQRLYEIVAFLCQQEHIPIESLDWRAELRYLAIDMDFWRDRFIEALKSFLQSNPILYREQAEFLFATAAASTGDIVQNLLLRLRRSEALGEGAVQLISANEQKIIEKLTDMLDFASQPEALSYLRSLLEKAHG